MAGKYRGQEGNICHVHTVMSLRREVRENGRKGFLFYSFLIDFPAFVIF